jgi:hypothetical protein
MTAQIKWRHQPGFRRCVMWSADESDFFDDLDAEVDEMLLIEFL